ncbi:MAG: tetratricopeptide repeat protein, partial [Fimbriimonadales bacterium]
MDESYGLAKNLFIQGRLQQASIVVAQILARNATDATALQLQGAIKFQMGRASEGKADVERALKIDPGNWEAWNSLGLMLHLGGCQEEALAAFVNASTIRSDFGEAWMNRGFVLQTLGRQDASIACFKCALEAGYDNPQVRFFLGNAFAALSRHGEAIAEFDRALSGANQFADAWNNRGNSLLALGRSDEAATSLERGVALMEVEARQLERQAGSNPAAVQKRTDLAFAFQAQGRWRDALESVCHAKDPGLRFLSALILPVIFESSEMAAEALEHLRKGVARLGEERLRLDDPLNQVRLTSFHLPYFGVSERPYQEAIAQRYLEATPSMMIEPEHTVNAGRPRLGVISGLLRDHSVLSVFGGLIERLDRER